jgi:Cytochrome P460
MLRWPLLLMLAVLLPMQPAALPDGPTYTSDGQLKYPADYAEWVFLGAGLDMSYSSDATPDHSMFNSVFVNPGAYKVFKTSGHWPDGTVMVLENRGATGASSINKRGKTESSEVMGMEIHVKDSARSKGDGWAFYGFEQPADRRSSGQLIARPASCYSCHEAHAAVDTTFVQFYPTLLPIASAKGTLSAAYKTESAAKN